MKRARHTEEQIIAVLQEAQAGATIEELCRRHGISAATYYKGKPRRGSQRRLGKSTLHAPVRMLCREVNSLPK